MTRKKLDYIIIGQGLAGSTLAIKLLKLNKQILVIDEPDDNTSSRVAAGLFNPITGRKMVKTWLADKLFPALHTHYREVEALAGDSFFHSMPVYRPFISIEEQNEWMGKSPEPQFSAYVASVTSTSTVNGVSDIYGGLTLTQCGYVDTVRYISSVRKILDEKDMFLKHKVSDEDFEVVGELTNFQDFEASKVVFCNGTHDNKWFGWLPVKPLKGEALTVKAAIANNMIINRGVYVVPTRGKWRVGATYNYNDLVPGTTQNARQELSERLQGLITESFEIEGQEWGLRPTTPDRRPMLGRHPGIKSFWIFNGLGTKGVSLAPYFAEVLIHSMENGEPLNKEVDIERFKLLYWTSP
ncbi:MAG: FAD-binding oxidoreductase [Chryseolinea sp.]